MDISQLSFKENASVNALRQYIVIAAMAVMKEGSDIGSAPPQSQDDAQTQDDECCYECNKCKEVTFYSEPLPAAYPFPRCLSNKCLLEIVRSRRRAHTQDEDY